MNTHNELAENKTNGMNRTALPFHATPSPESIVETGFDAQPRPEDIQYNIEALIKLLPEESKRKIEESALEEDPVMGALGPDYWFENEAAFKTLKEELEKTIPGFQMIWGTEEPSQKQLDLYGRGEGGGMVEFQDENLIHLLKRNDDIEGQAWISPGGAIPADQFKLASIANKLDDEGHHDLADKMERLAFEGTPFQTPEGVDETSFLRDVHQQRQVDMTPLTQIRFQRDMRDLQEPQPTDEDWEEWNQPEPMEWN